MANNINFDANGKVRIIGQNESELCSSIVSSTKSFISCVDDFESIIQKYLINILEMKSSELKDIKLKSIGLNNKILNEIELRKEKENELKLKLKSKQNELKKLKSKYQSLCNVESKQNNTINKLLKLS